MFDYATSNFTYSEPSSDVYTLASFAKTIRLSTRVESDFIPLKAGTFWPDTGELLRYYAVS